MARRPLLLDLFCGAGGASVGYHRAGFDVVGVDINPQPNYPFEFYQSDALSFPTDGFDVIHASPPCQAYSTTKTMHSNSHPDLIGQVRHLLRGKIYIIENVPGAPLNSPIVLCGEMFGLRVIRHRLFEISLPVTAPIHRKHVGRTHGMRHGKYPENPWYFGVYGDGTDKGTTAQWKEAMEIDWMTRRELAQAIPPAYSEYIGQQLIEVCR